MTLMERYREMMFRWFHADHGITRVFMGNGVIRWRCNCGKELGETDFKKLLKQLSSDVRISKGDD